MTINRMPVCSWMTGATRSDPVNGVSGRLIRPIASLSDAQSFIIRVDLLTTLRLRLVINTLGRYRPGGGTFVEVTKSAEVRYHSPHLVSRLHERSAARPKREYIALRCT